MYFVLCKQWLSSAFSSSCKTCDVNCHDPLPGMLEYIFEIENYTLHLAKISAGENPDIFIHLYHWCVNFIKHRILLINASVNIEYWYDILSYSVLLQRYSWLKIFKTFSYKNLITPISQQQDMIKTRTLKCSGKWALSSWKRGGALIKGGCLLWQIR